MARGAFAADRPLAESLQSSLGPDYEVHYPAMPSEDDPGDEMWRRELQQELEKAGDDAFLVGHSVGAYIVVRFIASDRGGPILLGVFLIATPFVGKGGWDMNEMALPEDFAQNISSDLPIFLYHARNDGIVPFAHLGMYRQKIPQATIREFETGGHQLNSDLSLVAADIRRIAVRKGDS